MECVWSHRAEIFHWRKSLKRVSPYRMPRGTSVDCGIRMAVSEFLSFLFLLDLD